MRGDIEGLMSLGSTSTEVLAFSRLQHYIGSLRDLYAIHVGKLKRPRQPREALN